MNPEKILNMHAGEEMDKLVSEKMMNGVEKSYSSNISDAWLIVEKLVSMRWRVDILYSLKEIKVNALKMVGNNPYSLFAKFGEIYADTVPEGICKLGLLAMIIEKEGW